MKLYQKREIFVNDMLIACAKVIASDMVISMMHVDVSIGLWYDIAQGMLCSSDSINVRNSYLMIKK